MIQSNEILMCLVKQAEEKPPWSRLHEVLYRIARGEATSEGVRGIQKVLDTIVNRSKSSGKDLMFEARKPFQYSVMNPAIENPSFLPRVPHGSPQIGAATSNMVRQVVGGTYKPTSNFTHYFNPNKVKKRPDWSLGLDGQKIGNHLFFSKIAPYK